MVPWCSQARTYHGMLCHRCQTCLRWLSSPGLFCSFCLAYLKLCSSFFDHPSSWNAAAWSEGRGRREACKQSFLFLGTLPFGYPSGCLVCVNPNLHVDQGSDRSQRPTHLINNLWFVIHSYVRHFFFFVFVTMLSPFQNISITLFHHVDLNPMLLVWYCFLTSPHRRPSVSKHESWGRK